MRQLRESVIDLALDGMGDAPEPDVAMNENGDTQGQLGVDSYAAAGNPGTVDGTAASQCLVNNSHTLSAVDAAGNHDVHLGERSHRNSMGTTTDATAELADAELDDLVHTEAADDEFWEEDALADMMVAA